MNPTSARTLTWFAGILIVLALVILSPTGAFALVVLAAICAAIPTAFATQRPRLLALLLLAAAGALTAYFYPAFKRDRDATVRRVKERKANLEITMAAGPGLRA